MDRRSTSGLTVQVTLSHVKCNLTLSHMEKDKIRRSLAWMGFSL
ncbi:unnamed protein product [Brassica oleracea var. botrytis]